MNAKDNGKRKNEQVAPKQAKKLKQEIGKERDEPHVHLTNKPFPETLACHKNVVKNWKNMSEVQAQALDTLLAGNDALIQAKTGSGKTLAYLIPAIEMLLRDDNHQTTSTLVVILAPVRELCIQIGKVAKQLLGSNPHGIEVRVCVPDGGGIGNAKKHIVIGFPTSVCQLSDRGKIDLSTVKYVVLDEADALLSGPSKPLVLDISAKCSPGHQRVILSATMPAAVREEGQLKQGHAVINTIQSGTNHVNANTITEYAIAKPEDMLGTLLTVLKESQKKKEAVLVFCPVAKDVIVLVEWAKANGLNASAFIGKVSYAGRTEAIQALDTSKKGCTVFASDLAARGLDFANVSTVIQFGLPRSTKTFIHRIGRTGRMGKAGRALSIFYPFQQPLLKKLGISKNIHLTQIDIQPTADYVPITTVRVALRCGAYRSFLSEPGVRGSLADATMELEQIAFKHYALPTFRVFDQKSIARVQAKGAEHFAMDESERHLVPEYFKSREAEDARKKAKKEDPTKKKKKKAKKLTE